MESGPLLRHLIIGQLNRNFILTRDRAYLDVLGGSLIYAAAGLGIWEQGNCGLVGRVGEDFPQEWLGKIGQHGFDLRGIRILPQSMDMRAFVAYVDDEAQYGNPVSHFSRAGLPYPKALLGFTPPGVEIDSRVTPTPKTVRLSDIPQNYMDCSAAHLCPLDYVSHTLIPSTLRGGHISTITLDPSAGYMNPTFWENIPALLNGITAFLTSEAKLRALFQGRSDDLWEMAQALSSYGCELIVIKRGSNGQYLYDHTNHTRWIIPAYPARVVDPSGAGDAFCGGFLSGYRNTYSPLQAALFGNISASLTVEGNDPFYCLDALPALAQARLEALQHMVRKA